MLLFIADAAVVLDEVVVIPFNDVELSRQILGKEAGCSLLLLSIRCRPAWG